MLKCCLVQRNPVAVPRYKVSISKVIPRRYRHELEHFEKCMLCVSLGNRNAQGPRLEASSTWIAHHFDECAVVPIDSIYRYTLQLTQGVAPAHSREQALAVGRAFHAAQWPVFQKLEEDCHFRYLPASEVETSADFQPFHQQMLQFWDENERFRQSTTRFAAMYLGRRDGEHHTDEVAARQLKVATAYLLEESALFASLAKAGWRVFVYPGSIKTFEEIATGVYPTAPAPLQELVWCSLRLDKRRASHALS